jgi:hypothetical protein
MPYALQYGRLASKPLIGLNALLQTQTKTTAVVKVRKI